VYEIYQLRKDIPLIEQFLQPGESRSLILVAGSTWEKDEDLLLPFFNQHPEMKLIIAPHEICENRIQNIQSRLQRPAVRYSQADETSMQMADCLIMDCFGLLSSVYRYGQAAYVGGGFGAGIHNILEAAVYAIPVLFGTNYQKFKEAKELIACSGAFSVSDEETFSERMNIFLQQPDRLQQSGKSAGDYVQHNLGATHKIYENIFPLLTYTTPNT
jgi:3-deoxy-D-manno-octulosonic-acid transferase